MDFASTTITEVPELCPVDRPQEKAHELRPPAARPIARGVYGLLTAIFALLAFGLFVYFAYRACGATGILIASGATFSTLWVLARFVLLC